MKRKTHFTRKNLIFLSMVFFFLLLQIFVLLCLDTNSNLVKKQNPIASFSALLGFSTYKLSVPDYVTFLLIIFWTFMCVATLLYEYRLTKYYEQDPFCKKYIIYYAVTILACLILSFGVSFFLQMPYSMEKFLFTNSVLWQTFVIAFLNYILFAGIITAIIVLYINLKNIDKPFRFFGKKEALEEEQLNNKKIEQARINKENSDLSNSLDIQIQNVNAQNSTIESIDKPIQNSEDELKDKQKVFPGLCLIDNIYEYKVIESKSDEITLETLCSSFRNYLASKDLFFELRTIREFVASFSTSRLIILEGLSGTGKSSLPRYFAEFLKSDALFVPVQATWRDRTSLLGYYNDFSKSFNETDFLKRLYKASYTTDEINLMVLDELNLSRIEYYFADFLSILEYPSSDWKLTLMQLPYSFESPNHVIDGKVQIPENTFFIGTANKDDSTYTITDKVYDRAITINFDDRNEKFEVEGNTEPINLTYSELSKKFIAAQENIQLQLSKEDINSFKKLVDYTYETFDVTFGNRILNQISLFVPAYISCGGTKEEALDFLFTRKILYKLEGRFEDYVKTGLIELKDLINSLYGNKFNKSLHEIDKMLKRL